MKVLIFTFCSHQKRKYNYNKNTKVYMSVKMKKKKKSNVKLKYLLTWQLQNFSPKNELNKTFFLLVPMLHVSLNWSI